MKCPFCSHADTQVVETRISEDGDSIRRRRQCASCEKRFTTYERPDVTYPAIVKKDGRRIEYERSKLLAASMTEDEMRDWIGVNSLKFISLDGLYRAAGQPNGRDNAAPQYCDACFSGQYPVAPSDKIAEGFEMASV